VTLLAKSKRWRKNTMNNTACGDAAGVDCIGRMVMRPSDRVIASQFAVVFEAIKELITPPEPPKKQIGFHP